MQINLATWQKILLVLICFTVAVVGFMIKLPSGFRGIDKELHAIFYFLAAALLNILFAGRKLAKHFLIFGLLYLFGMAIEWSQQYSNRFFRTRIHGRFDPEDIQWNFRGLMAFSIIWVVYTIAIVFFKTKKMKKEGSGI